MIKIMFLVENEWSSLFPAKKKSSYLEFGFKFRSPNQLARYQA